MSVTVERTTGSFVIEVGEDFCACPEDKQNDQKHITTDTEDYFPLGLDSNVFTGLKSQ